MKPADREGVDAALAHATKTMHELVNNPFLVPLHFPGLSEAAAKGVDMAERTILAMGAFRLALAKTLGSRRTALSHGLDLAADEVEERAIALAIHGLAHPALADVRAANPAAYQQLLNKLTREHGREVWSLAGVISDAAAELDLTLESGVKHGVMLSVVTHQQKLRKRVHEKALAQVAGSTLPIEAAVTLWLLAARGLGQLFGEDDKTLAYAD